ncbi:MAG: phosphate ABC transporter substrate-binding protein [Pseudomonadales bacterium]|nr:phosphate ABC transporter substrate-binding protein [Pseudomonadales bacterium]
MPAGSRVYPALHAIAFLLLAANSHADIAVIVSKDSTISSATTEEVSALFLAKTNRLKGTPLTPIDMINGEELRNTFYRLVTKKSPMQMKAYWSRLIFTGKGIPPPMAESAEDVIDMIIEEPDHIGYVSMEEVNDSVKVLLTVVSSKQSD